MRDVGTPCMLVSFPLPWGSTLTEAVSGRKGLFRLPDQGCSPSRRRKEQELEAAGHMTSANRKQRERKASWCSCFLCFLQFTILARKWCQSQWVGLLTPTNRPPHIHACPEAYIAGVLDPAKLTPDTNYHTVEVTSLLSCLSSKLLLGREKWDGGRVGRLFFHAQCSGIVTEVSGSPSLPWSSIFLLPTVGPKCPWCCLWLQSVLWSVVGISPTHDIGLSDPIEAELLWDSLPCHYLWVFPNKSLIFFFFRLLWIHTSAYTAYLVCLLSYDDSGVQAFCTSSCFPLTYHVSSASSSQASSFPFYW